MTEAITWLIELAYRVAEMFGVPVPEHMPVIAPGHTPAPETMPIIKPEPPPVPDWYTGANPIDAIRCILDPNCLILLAFQPSF